MPAVRAAVGRGVHLDVGHGAGSFAFDVAERALAQDLLPGTISSDLHQFNIHGPVFDLATTLSKFLHLGPDTGTGDRASDDPPGEDLRLRGGSGHAPRGRRGRRLGVRAAGRGFHVHGLAWSSPDRASQAEPGGDGQVRPALRRSLDPRSRFGVTARSVPWRKLSPARAPLARSETMRHSAQSRGSRTPMTAALGIAALLWATAAEGIAVDSVDEATGVLFREGFDDARLARARLVRRPEPSRSPARAPRPATAASNTTGRRAQRRPRARRACAGCSSRPRPFTCVSTSSSRRAGAGPGVRIIPT